MNEIYKKYKNNEDIKMLLQIHDELIFEIKNEKVERYSLELQEIMENIFQLDIPLKVSICTGKNWGELK